MARKKKSRGGRSHKVPLSIVAPMAVVGYGIAKNAMEGPSGQNMAVLKMTGFDMGSTSDRFKPMYLVGTYGPVAAGFLVHKMAGRLGVNRYIPKWMPVSI